MKKEIFKVIILALFLSVLAVTLVACGDDEEPAPTATVAPPTNTSVPPTDTTAPPTNTPVADTAKAAVAEQPISPVQPDSPFPAPAAALPPAPEAKTTSDTGAITGSILVHLKSGDKPVTGILVGLAEVIRDDQGVMKVAGYDPATPDRTDLDEWGRFALNNVEPGTYTVILDAIGNQVLLDKSKTKDDTLIVEVEAGKVTDLGLLEYDKLQISGYTE